MWRSCRDRRALQWSYETVRTTAAKLLMELPKAVIKAIEGGMCTDVSLVELNPKTMRIVAKEWGGKRGGSIRSITPYDVGSY